MEIEYNTLTIDRYEQLVEGWSLLPKHAIGLGDDKDSIEKYLIRNEGCSIAAFFDGKMVGAILAGHDGRRGFFHHLFVVPKFQGMKIGSKLVELASLRLKAQGILRAAVFVHKTNIAAKSFWKKVGFETVDFIETYGMDI